ncbi:MAG: sugar phosphate nucleotidyltransferase [Candidatus Bathyarchaeota archaeon]|jgi:glucose-1-phosphate cytidylyltransferase|nr:sugar phosphate nucleotidyltransferase [Candidatus Bathyarchaeota archaeon]
MKVVLFCGGMGLRLHPSTEKIPKPLVQVGGKPVLLQLMKYYSYFGHKDFILCLGYKGDEIKKFFLNYDECLSGDFVLSKNGKKRKLFKSEIENWRITFAETGLHSLVGDRLKKVEKYLYNDEVFLANYSDGLTDLYLPDHINYFMKRDKIASMITVKPTVGFHYVSANKDGYVNKISQLDQTKIRFNGGFFVFKNQIFDYINPGEDLVFEPFQRLMQKKQLVAYKYDGFWASLDTYKDKQRLDELASKNASSWEIWNKKNLEKSGVT